MSVTDAGQEKAHGKPLATEQFGLVPHRYEFVKARQPVSNHVFVSTASVVELFVGIMYQSRTSSSGAPSPSAHPVCMKTGLD